VEKPLEILSLNKLLCEFSDLVARSTARLVFWGSRAILGRPDVEVGTVEEVLERPETTLFWVEISAGDLERPLNELKPRLGRVAVPERLVKSRGEMLLLQCTASVSGTPLKELF